MSNEENSIAHIEQDLVATESRIQTKNVQLSEVKAIINEKNAQITNYEQSFRHNHITVERKQNYMDECNRTLGSLLERHDVSRGLI